MNDQALRASDALNSHFFIDFPRDAARKLEELKPADVVDAVSRQRAKTLAPVWRALAPDIAATLLKALPEALGDQLIAELSPPDAARMLGHMAPEEVSAMLARLDPAIRTELETITAFPQNTAGNAMDSRVMTFRGDTTAGEALSRLREAGMRTARSLFLVDGDGRLSGRAALAEVALADPNARLGALQQPVPTTVRPIDPIELVTEAFQSGKMLDVPVLDLDGRFLGAVTHSELAQTIQADATTDLQTMVGASKQERALSNPLFAVRKRMPWLQINLLTAFLAAAVVGAFEATIAQVTALAVLLPVVAGQSGNTGAQALAVTMRGLALREITIRQWARVMRKEVLAGFVNGLAIALTCAVGVFIWSQSLGLVAVIAASMVLAMIAAGFAGAVIPMILTKLGQDPATSSSIILTTVTDVAGFFSFLGIATLMLQFL